MEESKIFSTYQEMAVIKTEIATPEVNDEKNMKNTLTPKRKNHSGK